VKKRGRACRYILCYRAAALYCVHSPAALTVHWRPDSNFDLACFCERASNRCVPTYTVTAPQVHGCLSSGGVSANAFLQQSIARRTNERFSRVLSLSRARWASIRSGTKEELTAFFSLVRI